MTEKPYTDVDVKLVEQAILHADPPIRRGYINGPYILTAEAEAALDALAAAGRLAPVEPDAEAVQRILDDATRAFPNARPGSERVELIRDLLEGWYAAWPASAVTDEHDGIARHLAALIDAAEARAVACPCLPGAPTHRHGVGGYSTSAEAACCVSEPGTDLTNVNTTNHAGQER